MLVKLMRHSLVLLTLSATLSAALPDNVAAVVKMKSPKTLSANLMAAARVIQPGQQTEMLPLLFLGSFGYPSFPGVSTNGENFSVFIFEDDSAEKPFPMVILAKVEEDAQIRESITSMGWLIEDREQWLLISNDPANFDYIKDLEPFIEVNNETAEFDIQARYLIKEIAITEMVDEMVADPELDSNLEKRRLKQLIDFITPIVKNLEWAEIGMNFSDNTIDIGTLIQAIEGSPEAALINTVTGDSKPEVAKYVSTDAIMSYAGDMNYSALKSYTEVLIERAKPLTDKYGHNIIDEINSTIDAMYDDGDGTYAANMSMNGKVADVTGVYGGNYSESDLVTVSETLYNKVLPDMLKALPGIKESGLEYEISFDKGEDSDSYEGLTIHKAIVSYKVEMDEEYAKNLPPDILEQMEETTTTYMAVYDGDLLFASTIDSMNSLISVVKAGKSVDHSIQSKFSFDSGYLMEYQFDMIQYLMMGFSSIASVPGMEQYVAMLEQLKSLDMAPATGFATAGDQRLKSVISLPVKTIADMVKYFQLNSSQESGPADGDGQQF